MNNKSITPNDVEDIFSRVHVPPPKEVLMPLNTSIVNETGPYAGRKVLGMHIAGENSIFVPSTSPSRTVLHEATHNMGLRGETVTRVIAAISNFRYNFGILPRLRGHIRRVKYDVEELSPDESAEVLQRYGLGNANIRIIRMRLKE